MRCCSHLPSPKNPREMEPTKLRWMGWKESTKMNTAGSRPGPLHLANAAVPQRLSVHG